MTLTFGDVAENHVRMQQVGKMADDGFGLDDLQRAMSWFSERGVRCELLALHEAFSTERVGDGVEKKPGSEAIAECDPAWVLIARDGLSALGCDKDALMQEHAALPADRKAFMRGRVVNKHARYNLCYADFDQEPEYAAAKGRVVSYARVPLLRRLRKRLPEALGARAETLNCELNVYYDASCTGIGFHGDAERKRVVAVRLGQPIPLHYHWFLRHVPVGTRVQLELQPGDMYVMSEKASGNDWRRSSVPTLRHAAGASKFLRLPAYSSKATGKRRRKEARTESGPGKLKRKKEK